MKEMGLGLGGGLGTIVEESGLGLGQSHSEFIDEEEEFGLQLPPPAHFKQPHNMRLSEKIQRCIIQTRCTDNLLFACSVFVGICVALLQTLPLFMNNWVFLTEPRPINKKNDNGEPLEDAFHYNTGYFQLCRHHINNHSGIVYTDEEIAPSEAAYRCHFIPFFSGEDLTDFSVASLAVITRLGIPALLQSFGSCVCVTSFMLGVIGHLNKTYYSLVSSIGYILGSIIVCTAVLMVVCVVDDELAPRMKPNSAGEPSQFSYYYGPPFFSSSLSFIPVQICACIQAFLYFRRFPSVAEKLKFVPGLEAKLRAAQLDKEFGIPPLDSWRRNSLVSYLPLPFYNFPSRRNSRRSSQASFSNPAILY
ncbi:hypothetical protein WR25_00150 isoform A [Diploscapter pachys]|uniref:Uncharacterized protein n=3 Tax=Diploscapter pachys TaxID=2018661 RepID=A0A2A2JL98_9BILA|nr:hypothetical protein WR25_00150 isoform A [Diploscapter pachys]